MIISFYYYYAEFIPKKILLFDLWSVNIYVKRKHEHIKYSIILQLIWLLLLYYYLYIVISILKAFPFPI